MNIITGITGLQSRMNEEEVLSKIKTGAGRMPSFASIIAGKEEVIVAYLFEKESRPAREIAFLKEINKSEAANHAASEYKSVAPDRYLDLQAFSKFRDSEGHLGIKPP